MQRSCSFARLAAYEHVLVLLLGIISVAQSFSPLLRHKSSFSVRQQQRRPLHPIPASSRSALYVRRGGGGGSRPPVAPAIPVPIMNKKITAREIRVVVATANGKDEALGVMSLDDALQKAQEMGKLDLIMINDKSDPPVCKIADYSKYQYMQQKKAKEVKKNSKQSEIKEVKMTYKIDVHDYDVRVKNAGKFLRAGNRVKATVMFRGREISHDELGYELLDRLQADLDDVCVKEARAKREGRNLSVILQPRVEVMKQLTDDRRAEEKARKLKKQEELERRNNKEGASFFSPNGASTLPASIDDEEMDEDDVNDALDNMFGDEHDDLFNPS